MILILSYNPKKQNFAGLEGSIARDHKRYARGLKKTLYSETMLTWVNYHNKGRTGEKRENTGSQTVDF